MGATMYVSMTTREYCLLARLEGAARALLATPVKSSYDESGPAREAMAATLTLLDRQRDGKR